MVEIVFVEALGRLEAAAAYYVHLAQSAIAQGEMETVLSFVEKAAAVGPTFKLLVEQDANPGRLLTEAEVSALCEMLDLEPIKYDRSEDWFFADIAAMVAGRPLPAHNYMTEPREKFMRKYKESYG